MVAGKPERGARILAVSIIIGCLNIALLLAFASAGLDPSTG
jgi:hypothetical protein